MEARRLSSRRFPAMADGPDTRLAVHKSKATDAYVVLSGEPFLTTAKAGGHGASV